MIYASKAKQLTEESISEDKKIALDLLSTVIRHVEDSIQRAAAASSYYVFYPAPLDVRPAIENLKDHIESFGYKVIIESNGRLYITWR